MSYKGSSTENFYLHSEWEAYPKRATANVYTTQNINSLDVDSLVYADVEILVPLGRYSKGIVLRLIIPIALLLLLAAATFYVENPESRIAATTGLMIAVTAIYIVILAQILFTGYATKIDKYVLSMIVILAAVIVVHIIHIVLWKVQ